MTDQSKLTRVEINLPGSGYQPSEFERAVQEHDHAIVCGLAQQLDERIMSMSCMSTGSGMEHLLNSGDITKEDVIKAHTLSGSDDWLFAMKHTNGMYEVRHTDHYSVGYGSTLEAALTDMRTLHNAAVIPLAPFQVMAVCRSLADTHDTLMRLGNELRAAGKTPVEIYQSTKPYHKHKEQLIGALSKHFAAQADGRSPSSTPPGQDHAQGE